MIQSNFSIISSITHARKPQGLFFDNGYFKRISADTPRFQRVADERPELLVGVYDPKCNPEWIQEDIDFVRSGK